ncbi:PQ loop repeat-domain-containing protein [Cryomyces antarcticus]
MFPPSQGLSLDITAISGILGAISIACWVVVFSPQILENFQRKSADALSVAFIVIWLAGDIFNILGGVLQGVLPTMNILAVYYTFADLVLLGQLFYYRGFTFKDTVAFNKSSTTDVEDGEPNERTGLLANGEGFHGQTGDFANLNDAGTAARTRSRSTFRERLTSFAEVLVEDGDHLSPATPLRPATKAINDAPMTADVKRPRSLLRATVFNASIIILVCAFGASVWLIINRLNGSQGGGETEEEQQNTLKFNHLGQVFGYFCAALYLGSRVPQLHLNYRRKSTEGIAPLFFLFACIGNITYVFSIFAFEPVCRHSRCEPGEAKAIYGRYMLVNLSWLIGSAGCLLLDGLVFMQFWIYRKDEDEVAVGDADGAAQGRSDVSMADGVLRAESAERRGRSPNERR